MGSIIQSLPLLSTLRKNFPEARIIYVTTKTNRKLLALLSAADEIQTIEDSGITRTLFSLIQLLFRFWKNRADLYIDLETYSYFSTAVATLSCARDRFGFYRSDANVRLGVYTHMMYFNIKSPIVEAYLQMARLAGCGEIINKFPKIGISESAIISFQDKLKSISGNNEIQDLVVVNPNASDLRVERRWNADSYAAVINSLLGKYPDLIFVLTGSAGEDSWVSRVESKIETDKKNKVLNTAGKFSLKELFALIGQAKLVISNDSGPMHIAFALQKPVVALFGPCSPEQYGTNVNGITIYKNIYCSPCVHDFIIPPCKGDNQCMKLIPVSQVLLACAHLLEGNAASTFCNSVSSIEYQPEKNLPPLGIVTRNR
ncbi:MAG TPA: glycosyltransferase family 9 protein, partial [Bacteroidia bacterium]|nr:glycosyltransferase family 9 protein [Bacteroidia bacterium]